MMWGPHARRCAVIVRACGGIVVVRVYARVAAASMAVVLASWRLRRAGVHTRGVLFCLSFGRQRRLLSCDVPHYYPWLSSPRRHLRLVLTRATTSLPPHAPGSCGRADAACRIDPQRRLVVVTAARRPARRCRRPHSAPATWAPGNRSSTPPHRPSGRRPPGDNPPGRPRRGDPGAPGVPAPLRTGLGRKPRTNGESTCPAATERTDGSSASAGPPGTTTSASPPALPPSPPAHTGSRAPHTSA